MRISIVLFTKAYNSVNAKTRLRKSANWTYSWVTGLHNSFLDDSISTLLSVKRALPCDLSIAVSPEETAITEDYPSSFDYFEQSGDSFGERFQNALVRSSNKLPILIIGSDCPFLDQSLIKEAVDNLIAGKASVGPSQNNGFYLLAIPSMDKLDFSNCFNAPNERDSVVSLLGNNVSFLRELRDIDEPEDVSFLKEVYLEKPSKYKETKVFRYLDI